jgi:hypothetical protein
MQDIKWFGNSNEELRKEDSGTISQSILTSKIKEDSGTLEYESSTSSSIEKTSIMVREVDPKLTPKQGRFKLFKTSSQPALQTLTSAVQGLKINIPHFAVDQDIVKCMDTLSGSLNLLEKKLSIVCDELTALDAAKGSKFSKKKAHLLHLFSSYKEITQSNDSINMAGSDSSINTTEDKTRKPMDSPQFKRFALK